MLQSITTERHKKLIELLIQYRKKAGLTQTQLAKNLGLDHQSHIARLESGQRRIDVVEFLELSELLKFDAHEIMETLIKIPK